MKRIRWFFLLVLLVALLYFGPSVHAEGQKDRVDKIQHQWFLTLYGGPHAQPDFYHVLSFDMRFEDGTSVAVAALAREFWRFKNWISFEIEGQAGKHFGGEHQGQFTGLIIGRWHWLPWDIYLDSSLAVGEGVSYNTAVSKIEKEDDEDATRWLNYLLVELTIKVPKFERWDLVYRIHHRSSNSGIIGAGASNYVCGGIKYSF
jgi:hypothetical protein